MNVLQKVTLQTLKKNRTRTIVTIIGVILSTAMVTAVAASAAAFRELLIETTQYEYGDWHIGTANVSPEESERMLSSTEVEKGTWAEELGCAQLMDFNPEEYFYTAPYLYVLGIENGFEDQLALQLSSGRHPKNAEEILLPSKLRETYHLGDTVAFELGQRYLNGEQRTQFDRFDPKEYFTSNRTKTYTICGFYNERFGGTGQVFSSAFTRPDVTQNESPRTVYLKLVNPRKYRDAFNERVMGNQILLHLEGVFSDETSLGITGFLCIILLIIVSASVALIYTAFSISVSERTKQFGLLSSVGSTKRQLNRMVHYEALVISAVGIPLGILSGLGGIGITFALLEDSIVHILGSELLGHVHLRLCLSPIILVLIVLISLATVLISAWVPAKRATRVSAMEAIRQTNDVQTTAKEVRVSALTNRIFGVPGMLAKKYFQRSRKKYRSTILSLTMSVVLFITGWSAIEHSIFSMRMFVNVKQYDLDFTLPRHASAKDVDADQFLKDIQALPSVEQVVYNSSAQHKIVTDENGPEHIWLNFVSQNAWDALIQTYHLDHALYNDPSAPLAIAVDGKACRDPNTRKIVVCDFLNGDTNETIPLGYGGNQNLLSGKTIEESPWYVYTGDKTDASYALIYPWWALDVLPLVQPTPHYKMLTNDVNSAEAELIDLLEREGMGGDTWLINNTGRERKSMEGKYLVIKVFAGGFIALLSLITAANVFNTIYTNMSLRRRDFAMLKTIGMSEHQFHKMMAFECILYGAKSLLYGLTLSICLVFGMEHMLHSSMDVSFRMPWIAAWIAAASIFALIFISTLYPMRKMKANGLMDTLKNENL